MQRYFIDQETGQFNHDQIHHMLNVMRFKDKDQVEICENGSCYLVELRIDGKQVSFSKISKLDDNKALPVTIVQGLPKGDKIDDVTKYATLFGAKRIIFVPMKRSIAKLANIEHKLSRLKKISMEAAELAKRSDLPEISFLSHIKELKLSQNQILGVCDEDEKVATLSQFINQNKNVEYVVLIGPEGGIDTVERDYFRSISASFITLGKNIIPTELAHIPVLNAIRYEV